MAWKFIKIVMVRYYDSFEAKTIDFNIKTQAEKLCVPTVPWLLSVNVMPTSWTEITIAPVMALLRFNAYI